MSDPVWVALIAGVQICVVAWINRGTKKQVAAVAGHVAAVAGDVAAVAGDVAAVAGDVAAVAGHVAQTNAAIEILEKNTNSIKDALVLSVGEAEHAKGKIAGRAELRQEERQSGIDDEGAG